MLSRPQIILLKRAQAEAGLDDEEYRTAIETISQLPDCRSSKDPRLTDRHLDNLLAWFEAIRWRGIDAGLPLPLAKIFRTRGYWQSKNQRGNTSRDRYTEAELSKLINETEQGLFDLGCSLQYVVAIQNRIRPFSQRAYLAAIQRTLKSKQHAIAN